MIEITRVKINGVSIDVKILIPKSDKDKKKNEIAKALKIPAFTIMFTYEETDSYNE